MMNRTYGGRGQGKTQWLMICGYLAYLNDVKIYANFKNDLPFERLDINKLVNFDVPLINCIILMDEPQLYFDSRDSGSPLNKRIWYFETQTRKAGVDFLFTDQFDTDLDIRLRSTADYTTICVKDDIYECFNYIICKRRNTLLPPIYQTDEGSLEPIKVIRFYFDELEEIQSLYDTYELYPIGEIMQEKDAIKEELREQQKLSRKKIKEKVTSGTIINEKRNDPIRNVSISTIDKIIKGEIKAEDIGMSGF